MTQEQLNKGNDLSATINRLSREIKALQLVNKGPNTCCAYAEEDAGKFIEETQRKAIGLQLRLLQAELKKREEEFAKL